MIIEDPTVHHELFALPRLPIGHADHMIGLYAGQLIPDDSTLQIGIGSLSDAVVSHLLLRHSQNDIYSALVKSLWRDK